MEGYLKHFAGGKFNVFSAGIVAHGLNQRAVSIMLEDGIDVSHHTSNTLDELIGIKPDFVLTVCDNASEHCPVFIGDYVRLHRSFADPAKVVGENAEITAAFRAIRNQIRIAALEIVDELTMS